MQAIELALLNMPITVYALNENSNYSDKNLLVVSFNNSLELATVKKIVDVKQDEEFVKIVRVATNEDKQKNCENCKYARTLLPEVKNECNNLGLDMKIGFITVSLDKTKISVNYTAEDRVDFRELIKILSNKFKARIEMRQLGNRDESKQVGALGVCGRVTCCKAFLNDFDKVSIKMAKNQNISLNPNRINGMCGRLLCCFRYEDEFYEDMQKRMPKINSRVATPDGNGVVSNTDFLRETVTVTFTKNDESTEIKTYPLSEITKEKK